MDLYADAILDHYRHPHHKTPLRDPTVTREEINASCGDALTLRLRMEGGIVEDVGWEGAGCAISQASMSLLSDELIGKTEEDLRRLSAKDIDALLGIDVGPRRRKCALLSLHALKNALRALHGEEPQGWGETMRGNGALR